MSSQIPLDRLPRVLPPFLYAEAAGASSPSSGPPLSPSSGLSLSGAGVAGSGMGAGGRVGGMGAEGITPELKASADLFFDALDEAGAGYVSRETARRHFVEGGVPEGVWERVWCVYLSPLSFLIFPPCVVL